MWSRKTKQVKKRRNVNQLKLSKKTRRLFLKAGNHNLYRAVTRKYKSDVMQFFKRTEHRAVRRYGQTLTREPED